MTPMDTGPADRSCVAGALTPSTRIPAATSNSPTVAVVAGRNEAQAATGVPETPAVVGMQMGSNPASHASQTTYHDSPVAMLRQVALELRDRCERNVFQTAAKATLPDGTVCTYQQGAGLTVEVGDRRLDVPESALDMVGLVPADTAASGATRPSEEGA